VATTAGQQVVAGMAERSGVGHVKPHDLQRTLATELLETGAPVHHVQAQLVYANAQTMLVVIGSLSSRRQTDGVLPIEDSSATLHNDLQRYTSTGNQCRENMNCPHKSLCL
jgi:integrase